MERRLNRRVLVIEDDNDIRRLITEALTNAGLDVVAAIDAGGPDLLVNENPGAVTRVLAAAVTVYRPAMPSEGLQQASGHDVP